ncbi:MAG: hypothetical protein ABIF77_01930, partial [bacterium]
MDSRYSSGGLLTIRPGRLLLILFTLGSVLFTATICAALPELHPGAIPGWWDYPLVPADHDLMELDDCRLTAQLPGNSSATYCNGNIYNPGDPTTDPVWARVYADDDPNPLAVAYWSTMGSGGFFLNKGPVTVRGGRHTLEMRVDEDDLVVESDESNNNWALQFIWTPYELTHGVSVARDAPPDRIGGWDAIPSGEINWYNCDGLRFESVGWWNAVLVRAHDTGDDYDCRLHNQSTGSLNGFGTNLGYSSRPAGWLDVVFVNRNVTGSHDWDVGVLNVNDGTSDYTAVWEWSTGFVYGNSSSTVWAANEYLQLYEFYVAPGDTGWTAVDVLADSPDQIFTVSFFDRSFSTGDLGDATDSESTLDGHARMFRHITQSGYYCLAVYREPLDGGGACSVGLQIGPALLDFSPDQRAGWHSPLVPRPVDDGLPGAVALPDTLYGNISSTFLNLAFANLSPASYLLTSPSIKVYVFVDDVQLTWLSFYRMFGWGDHTANDFLNRTVAGGRHTLTMRIDYPDEFPELDEGNNVYAEQYCWSPLAVPLGTTVTRPVPEYCFAGWADIGSGEPVHNNCDGLRMAEGDGWWKAMAVLSEVSTAELALSLYECLSGTKDGFADYLAHCYWTGNSSQFVWANFNLTASRSFDFGVDHLGHTAGEYVAEAVASTLVDVDPEGFYGP